MSAKPRARRHATASPRWLGLVASCGGAWLLVVLLGWALLVPASSKPSMHRPPLPLPVELDGVNVPPVPTLPLRPVAPAPAAAAKTDGLTTW